MHITEKDINFAIDTLSHPQCGDASDIKEAFRIAIELLKAWKELLEESKCQYTMPLNPYDRYIESRD